MKRIIYFLKQQYDKIISGDPLILKRDININLAVGKKSKIDNPAVSAAVSDNGQTELVKLAVYAAAFVSAVYLCSAVFSVIFGIFYKKRF